MHINLCIILGSVVLNVHLFPVASAQHCRVATTQANSLIQKTSTAVLAKSPDGPVQHHPHEGISDHNGLVQLHVFPQAGNNSKLRDPYEPLPSLLALLGLDASSSDDPEPPAGRKEFFFRPVSVTVYCLMFLVVETLIFHTCHLIARSVDDFSGKNPHSIATEVLATAERSAPFVPAVCLLFVANRMYVLASSQGTAEPQIWVKACVILATIGVAIQPFLVFGLALGTERNQSLAFSDLAGSEFDVHPRSGLLRFIGKYAQSSFKTVQIVGLLCLYGGIAGIMLSVLFFGRGLVPVSAAVLSAMLLAILYCCVEFAAWVVDAHASPCGKQSAASNARWTVRKAFGQLMTQTQQPSQKGALDQSVRVAGDGEIDGSALPRIPCQDALEAASQAVQRAPMFAVLLLAARQRQLLLSPPEGQPSPLQGTCFLLIIIAMFLEVLVSGYLATIIQKPGDAEKATSTDTTAIKSSPVTTALYVVQFILATISYGAALVIACCIYPPVGPDPAVPLSATMRCSLSLGAIFFFVHFAIGASTISGAMLKKQSPKLQESLMAAHFGVSFCPLLCMLFLGCRMRALQISENKGNPQWWAQDFMFVCVLATLVDCLCVSALPLFIGAVTKVDRKGRAKNEDRYLFGIYVLTVIRYIALLSLHISITMICMSIFTITPERSMEPRPQGSMIWVVATSIMWVTLAFLAASVLSSASVIGILVKLAIESVDRLFLDCEVTVESALVNIGGGYVNIKGLVCSNPLSGGPFLSKYLLKAELVVVKVDIKKLVKSFGKSVDILELFIQGIEVVFEKGSDGHSSNVSALLDFLKVNESTQPDTNTTQPDPNMKQTLENSNPSCSKKKSANQKQGAQEEAVELPKPEVQDAAAAEASVDIVLKRLFIKDISAQIVHPKLGAVARVDLGTMDFADFSSQPVWRQAGDIVVFVLKTFLVTAISNTEVVGQLVKAGLKSVGRNVVAGLGHLASKTCCGGGGDSKK